MREPALRCDRAKRDDELIPQIQRVYHANMQVYGDDKVWKQMNREGIAVARCTVERLMRRLGLRGLRRGKVVCTTTPYANARWTGSTGSKRQTGPISCGCWT